MNIMNDEVAYYRPEHVPGETQASLMNVVHEHGEVNRTPRLVISMVTPRACKICSNCPIWLPSFSSSSAQEDRRYTLDLVDRILIYPICNYN